MSNPHTSKSPKTNNAIMLGFVFTRARVRVANNTIGSRLVESDFGACRKPGYGESDSSKMAFGRVRLV